MPPRASTSKLSSESTPATASSRSPSASARAGSTVIKSGSSSSNAVPASARDVEDRSSDEDELEDDDHVPARKNSKAIASRSSKQRSSTSAATSVDAGQSSLEDQHNAISTNADDSNSNHINTYPKSTTESTTGLSKEELALADRRRRNRETQRAIRKKKANRLQEAELKVSIFETELETLKLKNRDLENELFVLKRELDDWRSGRIHANPSLLAVSASGTKTSAAVGSSSTTRTLHPHHLKDTEVSTWPKMEPEDVSASRSRASLPYQSYTAPSEERKILGKRRQPFDTAQHPDGVPVTRHYIHPITAESSRPRPVYHEAGSPPLAHSTAVTSARVHSPSVLQPIPTVPRSMFPAEMEDAAARRASSSEAHHPAILDTASNEEGSYGGSDPSPSSAGTVVPSYTSAFNPNSSETLPSNAASTLISEAVQAVRAQESALPPGAIPRDNVPRSHSILSATTSISDRPSSYDDYHDFWTSASNSQSQSDSLTSMSSYRGSAIGGHPYSSSHLSGAVNPGSGQGGGLNAAAADGMILSMSRSSLCASPVSMAEDREEAVYQGMHRTRVASKEEDIGQSKDISTHAQYKQVKPSLPSLSSSLKGDHYSSANNVSISPDRTASLPLPPPHTNASPPQSAYLPSFRSPYPQHQIHHNEQIGHPAVRSHAHSRSPDSHPHTLPPIASVFQSRQATLPSSSHPDHLPPAKKQFLTRNGRGKTTSYPIFEGPHGSLDQGPVGESHSAPFQWPSSAPPAVRTSVGEITSYEAASVLPLPQRAATRAPLSSTRDDDSTAKTKSAAADRERADPLLQEDEGNGQLGKEIVMSPSDYNVDDNGFAKDVVSGQSAPVEMDIVPAEGDKKLPPRRRSTYEDFVELFGSQGAA